MCSVVRIIDFQNSVSERMCSARCPGSGGSRFVVDAVVETEWYSHPIECCCSCM